MSEKPTLENRTQALLFIKELKTDNTKLSGDPTIDRVCETLKAIVAGRKKVRWGPAKVRATRECIGKMVKLDGITTERIMEALQWYGSHVGEQYIPVIESGQSLREKFLRLEAARDRTDGKPKASGFKRTARVADAWK